MRTNTQYTEIYAYYIYIYIYIYIKKSYDDVIKNW